MQQQQHGRPSTLRTSRDVSLGKLQATWLGRGPVRLFPLTLLRQGGMHPVGPSELACTKCTVGMGREDLLSDMHTTEPQRPVKRHAVHGSGMRRKLTAAAPASAAAVQRGQQL